MGDMGPWARLHFMHTHAYTHTPICTAASAHGTPPLPAEAPHSPLFPAQFILADAAVTPNFQPFGVLLVAGALFADAFVGNTQESLFA